MSLEEKAYKALPISIRRYIMTNPEKYPEYSQVLLNKRRDILKKNKNKINLDPNEIKLMLTIVRIYNRGLALAEVTQNYDANKGRFGL